MSKCAVHMMKMKMDAIGGIQSHNQREHESRKNKDIDYDKSKDNFDTINTENINYRKAVKDRIAELNLSKSPRKDAVVYCSFIVSSDKGFFERLADNYLSKKGAEYEGWHYEDYKIAFPDKAEEFIREGSKEFFKSATEFFKQRYGAENVINGTVHMDEATPHMHLGVVPVTTDGRLSAKDLFTPLELKQLQTDFAREVGVKYNLQRGEEGSQSKHLDEISFKVQKKQEELNQISAEVHNLAMTKNDLCRESESLKQTIEGLKREFTTLDTLKRQIEQTIAFLQEKLETLKGAIENTFRKAERGGMTRESLEEMIRTKRMSEYIEQTGQTEEFERFCKKPSSPPTGKNRPRDNGKSDVNRNDGY